MNLILQAALRAGIPLVILTGIGIALLAQGEESNGRSTIAAGVIAAAVGGSSVVYRIERWSLPRQSVVHFAIMAVTVLPALVLSGWFPVGTPGGVLLVIGVFLLTGLVLWSLFFVIARAIERRARPSA